MGTTKNGNKLMGMSKKGKMIEFPKMIKISKNGKNDGNFQKWKNTGIFQKLNKCWKLNLLGEFPVLGWIPVSKKFRKIQINSNKFRKIQENSNKFR